MYDPAFARAILSLAEVAAIGVAALSNALLAPPRSKTLILALRLCRSFAVTVALFIPVTFFYVFTGAGPEASLATFPFTLIAAPLVFKALMRL